MAFVVFCIVKVFNAAHERAEALLRRQQAEAAQEEAPAEHAPTPEEALLREIRDLLARQTEDSHA